MGVVSWVALFLFGCSRAQELSLDGLAVVPACTVPAYEARLRNCLDAEQLRTTCTLPAYEASLEDHLDAEQLQTACTVPAYKASLRNCLDAEQLRTTCTVSAYEASLEDRLDAEQLQTACTVPAYEATSGTVSMQNNFALPAQCQFMKPASRTVWMSSNFALAVSMWQVTEFIWNKFPSISCFRTTCRNTTTFFTSFCMLIFLFLLQVISFHISSCLL